MTKTLKEITKAKKYENGNNKALKFLKSNYSTIPVKELAKILGRTENAIRSQIYVIKNELRINTKNKSRLWTKEEEKFLLENVGKLKNKDIAKALGRTEVAITLRSSYLKNKVKNTIKTSCKKNQVKNTISSTKESKVNKGNRVQAFLIGFTILNTILLSYVLLSNFIR